MSDDGTTAVVVSGDALADGFTWLTVAALSERVGRARSTIRLWRHQQRAWVPERLDEEGHQRYPLERIEEIARLAAQRLRPREITAEMERRHGPDASVPPADVAEPFERAVLARLDRLIEIAERIADRLGPEREQP